MAGVYLPSKGKKPFKSPWAKEICYSAWLNEMHGRDQLLVKAFKQTNATRQQYFFKMKINLRRYMVWRLNRAI